MQEEIRILPRCKRKQMRRSIGRKKMEEPVFTWKESVMQRPKG